MKKFRKILLVVVATVVALGATVVVVTHLPPVQRAVFAKIAAAIEEASGLQLKAESFSYALLPARAEMTGLEVSGADGRIVRVGEISAAWTWSGLLATPTRVDSLSITNPAFELDNLPESQPDTDGGELAYKELFGVLEIGKLELKGGRVEGGIQAFAAEVENVRAEASVREDDLRLDAGLGRFGLTFEGRQADFGHVELGLTARRSGIEIDHLGVAGGLLEVVADGSFEPDEGRGRGQFSIAADPAVLLGWLRPELSEELRPTGDIKLAGAVEFSMDGRITAHVEHVGDAVSVAGVVVDQLRAEIAGTTASVMLKGPEIGRLSASTDDFERFQLVSEFRDLPLDRILELARVDAQQPVPAGVVLSGSLSTELVIPVQPEQLTGEADLKMTWPDGEIALVAHGGLQDAIVERCSARIPGATLEAKGRLRQGNVDAEITVDAVDPGKVVTAIRPWVDMPVSIGGGPLKASLKLDGSLSVPRIDLEFAWQGPLVDRIELTDLDGEITGVPADLRWSLNSRLAENSTFSAHGVSSWPSTRTSADFNLQSAVVEELASLADLGEMALGGSADLAGSVAFDGSRFTLAGELRASQIQFADTVVDSLKASFTTDGQSFAIRDLKIGAFQSTLTGNVAFGFSPDDAISGRLDVDTLDPAAFGIELPPAAQGTMSASAEFSGTLARPEAVTILRWRGVERWGALSEAEINLQLADGQVTITGDRLVTGAGEASLSGQIPLGDFEGPAWLWPDAPSGPIVMDARASYLRIAPLLESFGVYLPSVEIGFGLEFHLVWDLVDSKQRQIDLALSDFSMDGDIERLKAEGPVNARLAGEQIVVEPFVLTGDKSRLRAEANLDIPTRELTVLAEGVLHEKVARLLPLPGTIYGPIRFEADVSGPLDSLGGAVRLDHTGGRFVMRDPAVEVKSLVLNIGIRDGRINIRNGHAEVNRGQVELGGAWDPENGQGIVAELDGVSMLLPMGILTRWDGVMSFEPDPKAIMRVGGDLQLEGGYWSQPFEYSSVLLGSDDSALAGDDPLHDIVLDLTVSGRNGIRVYNNLGVFEVVWQDLYIGGTAAIPVIEGQFKIPYGGILTIGAEPITVQRAMIEMVGDPFAPPRIEIVPVTDPTGRGQAGGGDAEDSEGINARLAATSVLADSLGKALGLGLQNESIEDYEISIETDTDSTNRFAIGKRLGRNVALILSTDLSNPDDQKTVLQLWNFAALPGFALQVFQETQDDVAGIAAWERLYFGGSRGDDERPRVHKLKFKGKWPMWKWKLRRAVGIQRGQFYDPFLEFAGSVRLEQELAGLGYHAAQVSATTEGEQKLPALVFECDLGPRQKIVFSGDDLPRRIRRATRALWSPPPDEEEAFLEMRKNIENHLDFKDHPRAEIEVVRDGDTIRVRVDEGPKLKLEGPQISGVPEDVAKPLNNILGKPTELAAAVEDEDRLAAIVRRQLTNRGYYDVRAVHVSTDVIDDSTQSVKINIDPGPRETLSKIVFQGKDPLGRFDDLRKLEGQPLDRLKIDHAVVALRRRYQNAGFVDAEVDLRLDRGDDGEWSATVVLDSGVQRRVARVEFSGNRFITDSVLRTGLEFEEGDVVDPDGIDQSASQIAVFQPVEHLSVETRPMGTGETIVDFSIVEKSRWTVGLGASYQSDSGFGGSFLVRDDNLLGRGFGLALRGSWKSSEQRLIGVASLPTLPGGRVSTSMTATYFDGPARTDPDRLVAEEFGLSLETTYNLRHSSFLRLYLRGKNTDITEPDPVDPDFAFNSTLRNVTVGTVYLRNHMDHPFDPRRGHQFSVDLEWSSSVFGSDFDVVSTLVSGSLASEPLDGWTWAQALRIGWAEALKGTNLHPELRFFAGGQASIRGFEKDMVGPLNPGYQGFKPAGGGALFVLNEEMRIPVWGDLRVAVFVDAGQVWDSWSDADTTLAVGAGFGLRYSTPIGPLWADIAWPVANRSVSEGYKFYFGIGRPF